MDAHELTEIFEQRRSHLRDVAARMLGSGADAEDVVQETWLRLHRSDVSGVDNLAGWLTTVTSRLCLDRLRARRARPEVLTDQEPGPGRAPDDPEHDAVVADSVGRALAVVLDTLSPAERVALVLHDVFAIPFDEIAPVLGRSLEATKKLAGRARRRARVVGATGGASAATGVEGAADDLEGRRRVVATFLDAVRSGDMAAMLGVLAPDAVRHVDPVLLPPGRRRTVHGAHVIVEEARTLSGRARGARPAVIDGALGAVVGDGTVPTLALTFSVTDGLIEVFEVIGSPERLAALSVRDLPAP